ncbi:MAG: hypothetical protein ABSF59_17820 [Candidatus Sulfotelmatobacter sp.]|jgi:hypothetical protein
MALATARLEDFSAPRDGRRSVLKKESYQGMASAMPTQQSEKTGSQPLGLLDGPSG